MKKILYIIPIICSLLFVGEVKAEEVTLVYEDVISGTPTYYTNPNTVRSMVGDIFDETINHYLDSYNSSYKTEYPYMIISYSLYYTDEYKYTFSVEMNMFKENPLIWVYDDSSVEFMFGSRSCNVEGLLLSRHYESSDGSKFEFVEDYSNSCPFKIFFTIHEGSSTASYNLGNYYYSNFNLNITENPQKDFLNDFIGIKFPSMEHFDEGLYSVYKFGSEPYTIKPSYLIDEGSVITEEELVEVNLNDYAYVALSLKDYNQTNAFKTILYELGQVCITPVYNYGRVEKSTNTNVCYDKYDEYTPINFFINKTDLSEKAIFYVKGKNTDIENKIKFDSNVFDVSYISFDDADNPVITVNGTNYTGIAYDKLINSTDKNTDNGLIPGSSTNFFESTADIFSKIFTAPLNFLKDIWGSITSVFSLITELISLLPPVMQNFLYFSFMLAVIIGLIKILL